MWREKGKRLVMLDLNNIVWRLHDFFDISGQYTEFLLVVSVDNCPSEAGLNKYAVTYISDRHWAVDSKDLVLKIN